MKTIDLNCDVGESFGRYKLGLDEEIFPYITSANIACGYHAADPMVMEKTVELAEEYNVKVGAHIGYPDLLGFGRRNLAISKEEAKSYAKYQIGALMGFCMAKGMKIHHVKPHGAFYNMAAKDFELACGICEAIHEIDSNIMLLGLSNSEMIKAANYVGIRAKQEVFADREYEDDGTLVSRTKDGAIITDEIKAINRMINIIKSQKVISINGKSIALNPDSVCVHGDGEKALLFVQKLNKALCDENITIENF